MCSELYRGSTSAPGNGSTDANGQPWMPSRGDTIVTASNTYQETFADLISEDNSRIMSSRSFNFLTISVLCAHAETMTN